MRTAGEHSEDVVGLAILSIRSRIQENQNAVARNRVLIEANIEVIKKATALIKKLRTESSNLGHCRAQGGGLIARMCRLQGEHWFNRRWLASKAEAQDGLDKALSANFSAQGRAHVGAAQRLVVQDAGDS